MGVEVGITFLDRYSTKNHFANDAKQYILQTANGYKFVA